MTRKFNYKGYEILRISEYSRDIRIKLREFKRIFTNFCRIFFVTNNFWEAGNLNKNNVGWLFLGLAGALASYLLCFGKVTKRIIKLQYTGEFAVNILGIKIAEGITTTERRSKY
jgi:hypothetical protein